MYKFFAPYKILQCKDEIYNLRQLHLYVLYETWLRFKKKFQNVPNHRILSHNFLEIFYRSLNSNNKAIVDTITNGDFMRLH